MGCIGINLVFCWGSGRCLLWCRLKGFLLGLFLVVVLCFLLCCLCLDLSLLLGYHLSIFDWYLPIDHSVVFKWAIVLCAILESEDSCTMFEVFFPVSFVFATI